MLPRPQANILLCGPRAQSVRGQFYTGCSSNKSFACLRILLKFIRRSIHVSFGQCILKKNDFGLGLRTTFAVLTTSKFYNKPVMIGLRVEKVLKATCVYLNVIFCCCNSPLDLGFVCLTKDVNLLLVFRSNSLFFFPTSSRLVFALHCSPSSS